MANVRNGNTYFIDATGQLPIKGVRVKTVIVTSSGVSVLVIKDVTTGATKLDLKLPAASQTQHIFFDQNSVMSFPNGIDVTTVTNCTATLVIEEVRG